MPARDDSVEVKRRDRTRSPSCGAQRGGSASAPSTPTGSRRATPQGKGGVVMKSPRLGAASSAKPAVPPPAPPFETSSAESSGTILGEMTMEDLEHGAVHSGGTGNISVFIRMRPAFDGEVVDGDPMRAVKLLPDGHSIYVRDRFVDERQFTFSSAFGPGASQEEVFRKVGMPAVDAALLGQNGTLLAYGQTGTGKTFTAFSCEPNKEGLMVRCVERVFERISSDSMNNWRVAVQYLQLYNDQLSDLLDPDASLYSSLSVREDSERGVYVPGARNTIVTSAAEVLDLFDEGNRCRVVRLTSMNAQSSRSHAIFTISIQCTARYGGIDHAGLLSGRLTIVDLAGSERIKRTKADGLRRQEAQAINMSLTCLGNVIHALTDAKATHVPYRACKLTRLLRDSLGEHGRASIIVTVSPALADVAETLGSLHFGKRALCVKQTNKINMEVDHKAVCARLQKKVEMLSHHTTDLEQQVKKYSADNKVLRETVAANESLIDELESHIRQVVKRQERLRGERQQRDEEVQEAQKSLLEMEEQLKDREEEVEKLLEEQKEEFAQQVKEYQEKIARLEGEILSKEKTAKETTSAAWEEERAQLMLTHSTELQKMREEVERLEQQCAERVAAVEAERDVALAQLEEWEDRQKAWEEEMETVTEALNHAENEKAAALRSAEQLEQQIERLGEVRESLGVRSERASSAAGRLSGEIEALKKHHDEEVMELRSSILAHREKLEEAQDMLQQCRIGRLSGKSGSPPTPIGQQCTQSRSASGGSMWSRFSPSPAIRGPSPCDHVEAALQSMQEQLDEERCSMERFRSECITLREEAEKLQEEKKRAEREVTELHNRAQQLEKEKMQAEEMCESLHKKTDLMMHEKKEDRQLLATLIKERDKLRGMVERPIPGQQHVPKLPVCSSAAPSQTASSTSSSSSARTSSPSPSPSPPPASYHQPPSPPVFNVAPSISSSQGYHRAASSSGGSSSSLGSEHQLVGTFAAPPPVPIKEYQLNGSTRGIADPAMRGMDHFLHRVTRPVLPYP